MSLIRRHTAYQAALLLWALVAFGSALVVVSGNAEPYVSMSDVPTGTPFPLFGGAFGAVLLGGVVVGRLTRRDWKRAGRQAGLAPTERSLLGKPELEGTVRGHTVRMRTVKRQTGSGGGSQTGGSSSSTYTVVEVDLNSPVHNGIMVTTSEDTTVFGAGVEARNHAIYVDGIGVIGADENVTRAVLTDRVREELRAPSMLDVVLVGDVSDTLLGAIRDDSGMFASMIYDKLEDKIEETNFADETTVSSEQKGILLDGTELARQVDALVAVTESFEAAGAGHGHGRQREDTTGRPR
jgi:hypothetical protein